MSPDPKEITYSLTYKEMLEILKIIDESPCQELRLELEGFKLEIIKERNLSILRAGFPPALLPRLLPRPPCRGQRRRGRNRPQKPRKRKRFRAWQVRELHPQAKSREFQGSRSNLPLPVLFTAPPLREPAPSLKSEARWKRENRWRSWK